MSRISRAFSRHSPLLIAFLVAGDPDPETSIALAEAVIHAGADILELGMPFSDPVADGPTIQRADERALSAGMTVDRLFAIVRSLRASVGTPIVLLIYYNIVYRRGIDRFYREAQGAGVDGILIVDMPPEESEEACRAARQHGIDQVFLVAETTSDDRFPAILSRTQGFLYLLSTLGVTGARRDLPEGAFGLIRRMKSSTGLPLAVGFGISRPEHGKTLVRAGADGVIVGSAIVRIIEENLDDTDRMLSEVSRFVTDMKEDLQDAGRTVNNH